MFKDWLTQQIDDRGGAEKFAKDNPSIKSGQLSNWLCGFTKPHYKAQLNLADALELPGGLREVRQRLGYEYSIFGEWLGRKILPFGSFDRFVKVTGLDGSSLQNWLNKGILPVSSRWGLDGQKIILIRDALIKWGDPSDPEELMEELKETLKRANIAKQDAKLQSDLDKDFGKITIPCNLGKSTL